MKTHSSKKHASVIVMASVVALGALSVLLTGCSKPDAPVTETPGSAGHPTTNQEYMNRRQGSRPGGYTGH